MTKTFLIHLFRTPFSQVQRTTPTTRFYRLQGVVSSIDDTLLYRISNVVKTTVGPLSETKEI